MPALLVLAVILFVLYVVARAAGWALGVAANLLWVIALVLLVIWLIGLVTGRRRVL